MVMMMTDDNDKDDDERDMSAEYKIVRKPPEARYQDKKRKVPCLPRGTSQSLSHRPSFHNTSSPPLSLLSGNLAISRNNELSPRETFSPHEFA